MNQTSNLVFYNHSLELKIQIAGGLSMICCIYLVDVISAWFLIGVIPSVSLIFPTAGTILNKENRKLTDFLIILFFKFRKTYDIDLSYELFITEIKADDKPIISNPLKRSRNSVLTYYLLSLESKINEKKFFFPFFTDMHEAENVGQSLSKSLDIQLTKILN